jgi:hypothetical protein
VLARRFPRAPRAQFRVVIARVRCGKRASRAHGIRASARGTNAANVRRIMTSTVAASFRTFVLHALACDSRAKTAELLAAARRAGYSGGKTAFYELVAALRGAGRVEIEPRAGEICDHDIGDAIVVLGGARRRVRYLASRLAYSQWLAVSVVAEETPEAIARAMLEAYASFGGMPMLARFARARVVARPAAPRPEWSISFACFAADLGVGIEIPDRSVRAQCSLSRCVRDEFFRDLALSTADELTPRLAAWTEHVNVQTFLPKHDVTAATLFVEEQRRLRPLPVTADALVFRRLSSVRPASGEAGSRAPAP